MSDDSKLAEVIQSAVVKAGKVNKAASGRIQVDFNYTFTKPPIVVVTPNWTAQVGYPETIVDVQKDKFFIESGNSAPNYYVSWVAVGI